MLQDEYIAIKNSEIDTALEHYLKPELQMYKINIDTKDIESLKYQLSKIRHKILDYTHQRRVEYGTPERNDALYHIWAEITIDLIKHLNALLDNSEETAPPVIGAITAISGGDTSYSFSDRPAQTQNNIFKNAHKIDLDSFVFDYKTQLQSHRIPASYFSASR